MSARSDSGGGGERVLWMAVSALLHSERAKQRIVVYCGDVWSSKERILHNVATRFGIRFDSLQQDRIDFVFISTRTLLDARWYPVCTMLFQSIGSIIVGVECVLRCPPDIFCDTTGAAFCYPFAQFLTDARIVAYVHYPIISTDMLEKVRLQRPSYNNSGAIARSVAVSSLKVGYYRLFAAAYSWAGRYANVVMVNSTWTYGHIHQLWFKSQPTCSQQHLSIVYPPCNTKNLLDIPVHRPMHPRNIISIGQFRPEKDHMLQLRAVDALINNSIDQREKYDDVKLVIIGSTRNTDDEQLLQGLRDAVNALNLQHHVEFVVNGSYELLQKYMGQALIGIHTMWNEHFGISVVEMLAAGLIVVAHNSGGPQMDIICTQHEEKQNKGVHCNGFLAETPDEYASTIRTILDEYDSLQKIRNEAKKRSLRFSDENFQRGFIAAFYSLYKQHEN